MKITINELKALISEAVAEMSIEEMLHGATTEESVQSKDMEQEEVEEALEEYMNEAKKKSMRLGGGGRFQKLVSDIKKSGKSEESAKAIAASIGRKKYGAKKMAKMAAAGRRRAAKE